MTSSSLANWDGSMGTAPDGASSSRLQLPVFPIRNPEGALSSPLPHAYGIEVGGSREIQQGSGAREHGGARRRDQQWQSTRGEYKALVSEEVHVRPGMSISRRVTDREAHQDASKGSKLIKRPLDPHSVSMIRPAHAQSTQRRPHESGPKTNATSRFRPKQPSPPLFVPNGLLGGSIIAPPSSISDVVPLPPLYEDRSSSADAEGEKECSDIEEIFVYKQPNGGLNTSRARSPGRSNQGSTQQIKKPVIPTIRKPNFTTVQDAQNRYITARGPEYKHRQPQSNKRAQDSCSPPLSPGHPLFTPPSRRKLPSNLSQVEDLFTPPPSRGKSAPDYIYVSSPSPPPVPPRSRQQNKVLSHIEPPPFHPSKPKHSYRPMQPTNSAKKRPSMPIKHGYVHQSLEVALSSSWQNNSALGVIDSVVEPSITILRKPQPAARTVPSMNAVAGPSRIPIEKQQPQGLPSLSTSLVGRKRPRHDSEDDSSNPFVPHRSAGAGGMPPPPLPRAKRPYKKKTDEQTPAAKVAIGDPGDGVTKTRKLPTPNLAIKYDKDRDFLHLYPMKTRPLSLDALAFNVRFVIAMAGGSRHSPVFGKGKGKEREVLEPASCMTAMVSWFQWPILEIGLDADAHSEEGDTFISVGHFYPWKLDVPGSQHRPRADSSTKTQSADIISVPKAIITIDQPPKRRPGRPPKSSTLVGVRTVLGSPGAATRNSQHHSAAGIRDKRQSQTRENFVGDARFVNAPTNALRLHGHSYPSPTESNPPKKRGRPPKKHAKPADHIPPPIAPSATQPAETINTIPDYMFHHPSFAQGEYDQRENSLFPETPNGSHPLSPRSVIDGFSSSLNMDYDLCYPSHDIIDPSLQADHIDGLNHSTSSIFPELMYEDHRLSSPMKFSNHSRPMTDQRGSPTLSVLDAGTSIDLENQLWASEEPSPANQLPAFGDGTIDPSLLGDGGAMFEPDPPSRSPSPTFSVSSRTPTPEAQQSQASHQQSRTPSPIEHRRSNRERTRTTLPDMVDTAELHLSSSSSEDEYDSDSSVGFMSSISNQRDAPKGKPKKAPGPPPGPKTGRGQWPTCDVSTFCHQCRSTTTKVKMTCRECKKHYCIRCLSIRYADVEDPPVFEEGRTDFSCPACEGTCTCDHCTRKRGEVYVSLKKWGSAAAERVPKQQRIMSVREPRRGLAFSTPPSLSPLPQITGPVTYWATIYGITGERVGTAFVGEDGNDDVVLARPLQPPPLTKRVFIGRVEPSWGFGARPPLKKLAPLPRRKTESTRLFVGNKRKLPRRIAPLPRIHEADIDASSLTSLSDLDEWKLGDSDIPSSPMKSSPLKDEEMPVSTGLEDDDVFRAMRLAFEALATVGDT